MLGSQNIDAKSRLCDSCGSPIQREEWHCKACRICFCTKCGDDFTAIFKTDFPECPLCRKRLDFKQEFVPGDFKEKLTRYLQSTKSQFDNEEDFIKKSMILFKTDFYQTSRTWASIKTENHPVVKLTEHKFNDKKTFRQMKDEPLVYQPKIRVRNIVTKTQTRPKKSGSELKETNRIDGLTGQWRGGKMSPAEQKTYRSSYEE